MGDGNSTSSNANSLNKKELPTEALFFDLEETTFNHTIKIECKNSFLKL
jgi:hypothetical protein